MSAKRPFFLGLCLSTLLLGAASESRAQWDSSAFTYYRLGGQARRNAYHELIFQGLQIRQKEELARAELARVKSMIKFQHRYTSLRLPGSSLPSASAPSSLAGGSLAASANVLPSNLGLTQRDVDAMRAHYEALAQFHTLRREEFDRRNPPKHFASAPPVPIDRSSGRVAWPALLREDSRFREDVRKVNQSLAAWTQDGCDPTSLAAIRVRKTLEKMTRDLRVMQATGVIDQTAYNVTRAFLERTAFETQCAGHEEARGVTAELAWAR